MKKILLFLLVLIIGGIAFAYYYINRPVDAISSQSADIKITAAALLSAFNANEMQADSLYTSKVILVSGKILKVNKTMDNTLNILLDTGDPMSTILCQMDKSVMPDTNKLVPGANVSIKGVCSGFLGDVVLDRAVVIEGK